MISKPRLSSDLAKKFTQILKIMKGTKNLNANVLSENGVIIAEDTDTVLLNADKIIKLNQIDH